MSLSITTVKTPFLSSLLISLRCESVKGVSCTKTDIFTGGGCLVGIPVELVDIPVELIDMPIEVMWFSVTGFCFVGYFWGRPRPRFIVNSIDS